MSTGDREALALVDDAIVRVPKIGGANAIYEAELLTVLRAARTALSTSALPRLVAEFYSPEMVGKWWQDWAQADEGGRERMERGVFALESGAFL